MAKKSFFLIDATAFCYRAFYALSSLRTSGGQPTNAVYGFINILNKILKENQPDYLVCCFDLSRDTFRLKKFAEYKMQRAAMPDDLINQIPLIKEVVAAYGVPIFEQSGFEADDLIAALARKAVDLSLAVTIVSSDKDILQLVNQHICVLSPTKDGGVLYDPAKVKERYGVAPKQLVDIIALMGDAADNIPGVPGIGEKTAQKLVLEFGGLENLFRDIAKVKSEKVQAMILEHAAQIKLNKELITLDQELKLDLDLAKAKTGQPDYNRLADIFKKLEFKKLLGELPQLAHQEPAATLASGDPVKLAAALKHCAEITIYGTALSDLIFGIEGYFYHGNLLGDQLRQALADERVKKTGFDLKKLKVVLSKEGLILNGLDFDVMIAAYLLNPARASYALEDLALENLGEFIRIEALSAQEALALIVRLKPVLASALAQKELAKLFFDLEMPLVSILALMEQDGIKLNLVLLKKLSGEIQQRLVKLVADIYASSGTQFNINSPKQLGSVLFEKLGLPVIKKTKTGASTDEEVLKRLSAKHPLPVLLLEYRQLTKLKNTYVDALPLLVDASSGRVHTCFNQTGTETGRLSSSNPNLQNIPIKTEIGAKIREAIIARGSKNCLLSCDYSQIELRVLAHLSHDETLINAFKTNQDVHRLTASLIYNLTEAQVEPQMREVAKRVNFGIIYGQSAFGLSKDLGISIKQAQDFIDAYFLRYPKVSAYIDAQIKKAQNEGFVTTLLGRRRYLSEINSKNMGIRQFAQRQAVNTPIQGTASDLIKLAMIKIAAQIKTCALEAKMILQIHDELVFDCPLVELKELSGLVETAMEQVMPLAVPIKVDMKKGANWLQMSEVTFNKQVAR